VLSAEYFRQLWDGRRSGAADRLVITALTLCSYPYTGALRLRAAAYRSGLFKSYRLTKPVISVGNLSVGGTGKTPMVAHLARWLMGRGKRVAVLSRGYGGSQEGNARIVADWNSIRLSPLEAGDEPYLLASSLPGLAVVIGTDRYRAGLMAQENLDPDIFILDDGFQHLRLQRDLNLLLLDCQKPFGNGRTLPAGILREALSAVERADLVIYTRCKEKTHRDLTNKPWCAATHQLTGAFILGSGETLPLPELENLRPIAFAGIAEPSFFFDSLKKAGVCPVATLPFPDHCKYGVMEIDALCRLKESSRSDCMITTEKDAVKLMPYLERLGKVYAARMELKFADARPLETALEKLL
jgi:tetraacyldisaccharide 4'-kinase